MDSERRILGYNHCAGSTEPSAEQKEWIERHARQLLLQAAREQRVRLDPPVGEWFTEAQDDEDDVPWGPFWFYRLRAEGMTYVNDVTKPIWLLDVDGVLNAVGMTPPKMNGHWQTWEQVGALGFGITFSPDLIARITSFVDEGLVEVHWLTTWWSNIPDLPFTAWHDWPVANTREEYLATVKWWKLPVAQRYYDQGHRIVWTDDDITFVPEAMRWLEGKGDRVLAVAPKTIHGLTPKHLDRIEEFLRA